MGAIHSKLLDLLKLLCEHFASELKEAFYFCEGLKIPELQSKIHKVNDVQTLKNQKIKEFEGKILWAEMTDKPCFTYDDKGFLINQTCYFIPKDDKYLCAVLNSKIIYFFVRQIASNLGEGAFRWIKQYVEKLPIPKNPDAKILTQIEDLASRIIELRKSLEETLNTQRSKAENKIETKEEIKSKELEQNLDSLIYKLYGLDEEEIKIIESEFSSKERERERDLK
ncbi:type IIS restriction /modification enzyme, N-terminal half [Helicobacter mustelae]|uniref:TaqI-like C-terminal specificity domain-containing protein n=1 Tax=Helicobacter mustelae TaxID=217 RepID=UPI000E06C2EC|nr:TaqI-like C-terminal specificity domain-containing protein [Helicobacter mustelae]STP13096.1 type IIS restriction /modification enzyme, N-terminal half [Helicobacter mustelae]